MIWSITGNNKIKIGEFLISWLRVCCLKDLLYTHVETEIFSMIFMKLLSYILV